MKCVNFFKTHRVFKYIMVLSVTLAVFILFLLFTPQNIDFREDVQGIPVYLYYSDIHINLILPLDAPGFVLRDYLANKTGQNPEGELACFGWGDRIFYPQTPRLRDMKPGQVLSALFVPTSSSLYVEYWKPRPRPGPHYRVLYLKEEQYLRLVDGILFSSVTDSKGNWIPVKNVHPLYRGKFYEAKEIYHVFYNCNDWVNRLLTQAGIRTPLWSPLPWFIIFQLDQVNPKP